MPEPQPPPGVHWLHVYDEMADDPAFDPHWCFDLLHPEDCPEPVPTSGVCEAHKDEGAPQDQFKSDRDEGNFLREMKGWCEDCSTAGEPVMEPHCGFQFDLDAVGDDAYAFPREWGVDSTDHRQHHANIEEGTYRVAWEHDGSGEDFCSWIEVHERVEA